MIFKQYNLLSGLGNKVIDFFLLIIILFSIIGFLSVKGATNTGLFMLLALSILFLKKTVGSLNKEQWNKIWPVIVILSLPVIAIAISQFGRQDWLIRSYDGPSRMLFSIPVFLLFIYKKVHFSKLIAFASPLALWLTALSVYQHPEIIIQESGRFATTFVRPNAFGTYAAILTSFCLFHLDTSLQSSKLWLLYQLSGVLLGFYLILGSGTRSSWIAMFVILLFWLFLNRRKMRLHFVYLMGLVLTVYLSLISYSPLYLNERFSSGFFEMANWFNNSNLDTPTGYRLSIWKISWQLFLHNPLLGYGERGYIVFLNEPWFDSTTSEAAKSILACCGAHNELIANLLRSGIVGALSVLCLVFVPFILFARNLSHASPDIAKASQLGLAYIICISVSSISIEVFNLKYLSSFYGLIMSGLMAQLIVNHEKALT